MKPKLAKSVRPFDRKISEFAQGMLVRRVGQCGYCLDGEGGLPPREARSVRKAPGRFNCSGDLAELLDAALFDAAADQGALVVVAGPQRIYKRQRGLAF